MCISMCQTGNCEKSESGVVIGHDTMHILTEKKKRKSIMKPK